MTKGFITIATGDNHYYEIAANLLLSYRFFTDKPYPFAIIAEEENEYTELFDDVIITNEVKRSFLDKFLLMKLCPYDETIFFDADCLAYGDLNKYWDFFKDATDFSAVGQNYNLSDNNGAWYNLDGVGKYGKMINYKTRVHAGVMFVRKTDKIEKFYSDCMDLYSNYDSLTFHSYSFSIDECILGVAMPINSMRAIPENSKMIAAYPCLKKLKANVYKKKLCYSTPWHSKTDGILLHWGTIQTRQALYKYNIEGLNCLLDNKLSFWNDIKYKYGFRLFVLRIKEIPLKINTIICLIKKKIIKG